MVILDITVFLGGPATFTVASLASGLASSSAELVAARALRGLGAAMLTPAALSIVMTTYTGRQQTAALVASIAILAGRSIPNVKRAAASCT